MSTLIEKKRVVLVEDHTMVREHLARVINKEEDLEVIGEADNIQSALEVIKKTNPHLAIVDMTLYAENGLEIVKTLKMLSMPVSVLVLTMHDESIRAERAFRAGAQGFITKHQPSSEIVVAIRRILSGKMYLSENMVDTVLRKLAPSGIKNVKYQAIDRLSDRELTILELIANGHSSRAIAQNLSLAVATVGTYVKRMRTKLNLASSKELQHFAIEWLSENG